MDLPTHHYKVRRARESEAMRLRAIEDEAETLPAGLGLIDDTLDASVPPEAAAGLVDLGQVWVGKHGLHVDARVFMRRAFPRSEARNPYRPLASGELAS